MTSQRRPRSTDSPLVLELDMADVSPTKKPRGCIAAPPMVPFVFPKETYLFFFAFFLAAILFSSVLL